MKNDTKAVPICARMMIVGTIMSSFGLKEIDNSHLENSSNSPCPKSIKRTRKILRCSHFVILFCYGCKLHKPCALKRFGLVEQQIIDSIKLISQSSPGIHWHHLWKSTDYVSSRIPPVRRLAVIKGCIQDNSIRGAQFLAHEPVALFGPNK